MKQPNEEQKGTIPGSIVSHSFFWTNLKPGLHQQKGDGHTQPSQL